MADHTDSISPASILFCNKTQGQYQISTLHRLVEMHNVFLDVFSQPERMITYSSLHLPASESAQGAFYENFRFEVELPVKRLTIEIISRGSQSLMQNRRHFLAD